MKRQTLAGTDLEVGRICLGTGGFGEKTDDKQARRLLDCFVDGGGCFIDTANVYCRWVPGRGNSSEQYIGRWLRDRKASGKVVVATKGGHYDLSRPQISRVTEADAAYRRWHEKTGIPLIPFSSGAQGFFSRLERAGVQAKGGAVVREGELSLIQQPVRDAYLNRRNLAIYERFLEIKKETGISMHSLTLLSLLGRSFQVIPVAAASRPDQVEEILEAGEADIMRDLAKEIQRFEEEEA